MLIPAKDFGENWVKIFKKPKQTEKENGTRKKDGICTRRRAS